MVYVTGYDDEGVVIAILKLSNSMTLDEVAKHITKSTSIVCSSFRVDVTK